LIAKEDWNAPEHTQRLYRPRRLDLCLTTAGISGLMRYRSLNFDAFKPNRARLEQRPSGQAAGIAISRLLTRAVLYWCPKVA